jgi:hypothetical protein
MEYAAAATKAKPTSAGQHQRLFPGAPPSPQRPERTGNIRLHSDIDTASTDLTAPWKRCLTMAAPGPSLLALRPFVPAHQWPCKEGHGDLFLGGKADLDRHSRHEVQTGKLHLGPRHLVPATPDRR